MTAIAGRFSCDNSYSVWTGDQTGVTTKYVEETNTTAGDIVQGENLTPIPFVSGLYLYICAWSGDERFHGLIGSFAGALTIHTGDPRWQVLPTGKNKNNNQFPTQAEINAAITSASPTDWKTPFVGAANGGPPWNFVVTGVDPQAHWIWFDSGKDSRPKYPASPYVPFANFDHLEFLIFRIPLKELQEQQPAPHEKGCCVVICPCCCKEHSERPAPPPPPPVHCCGSCVFEARLQRLRYVGGSPGFLDGWAELSFVTHLDGNQFNFPTANGSYIRIGKRQGKYWGGWYPVNARVGIIEVSCEHPRRADLMSEMIENPQKEKGVASFLEGGRPWGASGVDIVSFKCGEKPTPILQRVKLELGGNRTEDLEVELEYRFSQVTACSCCGCKSE